MILIISSLILLSGSFALLGTVSLWKKYVYFSDGLAHSSFLAVALASALNLSITFIGLFISIIFAFLILKLKKFSGTNQTIAITSNVMLAAGLLIINLWPNRLNITDFLLGDIIAINFLDFIIIVILSCISLTFIFLNYKNLVITSLNRDIARTYGIKTDKIEGAFLIILALSVFIGIKIVGVMLITTILIIPGMSAKLLSKTPAQMMIFSVIISLISSMTGLTAAFYLNAQIAPIIILTGVLLYLAIYYSMRYKQ